MILHILSDSPYTKKFIEFIHNNFDENEHTFIIFLENKKSKYLDFYQSHENCFVTHNKTIYFAYKEDFKTAQQVIMHQLNKPQLLAVLLLYYPIVFKKMVWSIWGGDLYFYQYKSNSLKDTLIEFLRKLVIKKIPVISSYIRGDFEKAVEIYGTKANYIKAKYPSPISLKNIAQEPQKDTKEIRILVGNSADPSNEHLAIFELLQQYKDENIKVMAVLSYGGSKEYIAEVIQSAKAIFHEKFEPIVEYMDHHKYLEFINSIDICVLNHKRQQGLGNVVLFLALKKKVFMHENTTPYQYYKDLGIKIYPTSAIRRYSFEKFIHHEREEKENNKHLILSDMDESSIVGEWMHIFAQQGK